MASSRLAGHTVELVSEFFLARRIPRWLSRGADRANGGAVGAFKVSKIGKTGGRFQETGTQMRVLFVDLEREWRGGQSQAFLTLRGLREKGHQVELLTARNSP